MIIRAFTLAVHGWIMYRYHNTGKVLELFPVKTLICSYDLLFSQKQQSKRNLLYFIIQTKVNTRPIHIINNTDLDTELTQIMQTNLFHISKH